MTIYTFAISKNLSNSLGIDHVDLPELSDQRLNEVDSSQIISVPAPHSEETKRAISEARLGQPAPNKGIPNPAQRERLLKNNPMKNPEVAAKVSAKLKGRPSPFRGMKYKPSKPVRYGKDGRKKTLWSFPDGSLVLVEDTRKMCDQLGLSYSAVRHKIGKGPYEQGKHKGLRIDRIN